MSKLPNDTSILASKRGSGISVNGNSPHARMSNELPPDMEKQLKNSLQLQRRISFKMNEIVKPPEKTFKEKLTDFVNSKFLEMFMILLIILYMVLVLVNVFLDNNCDGNSSDVDRTLEDLLYVEIVLVSIFLFEIALKVFAMGIKGYFRDLWYIVDALIIFATFGLVMYDVSLNGKSSASGIVKIRGLFRIFRILMLVRKASEIQRARSSPKISLAVDVKSPAEKIIELLNAIKKSTKDKDLIKELTWAVEMITSNKLYDAIVEGETVDKEKSDVEMWLKNYGNQQAGGSETTKNRPTNRRLSKFASAAANKDNSIKSLSQISKGGVNLIKMTPAAVACLEESVDTIEFNVFNYSKLAEGHDLACMTNFLFQRKDFFELLEIDSDVFQEFIMKIQGGYLPNPYHTQTHAADVLQTVNYLMVKGEVIDRCNLSNVEIVAMYLSAAVHDFEHPGTNNFFHVNTGSPFAITYNDKAVLESHHIAATFRILKDDKYNIFKNFTPENHKLVRERMISMVLATDMSLHFTDVAQLKQKLAGGEYDIMKEKNQVMNLIIHSADISNPAKPYEVYAQWTTRVLAEFFEQGDRERELGLPITNLCDRYTVNTAKSQIGFIDFVVNPLFILMKQVLPHINIDHLDINKAKWKNEIEFFDKELAALNERKKKKEEENTTK